ncbi:MAG: dihydrodipicolinate synthase family protein [Bryobacteraceae bacterium]
MMTKLNATTGHSSARNGGLKLAGIFAPTITAFSKDGSVNLKGVKQFVRYLLDAGVDGLAPLGSAGEPFALSVEERMQVLEAIVEETAGRVPIFAGVVDYRTDVVMELSCHARSLGCQGIMVITPYLLRPPKRDVLDHFRRVREKVGLPIMLYNVPVLTGVEITPEEVHMLAREDVIHAVKWSHVEVSRVHDTRLLCGPDFPVFTGIDLVAFEAMAVGADGWISGIPLIAPRSAVKLHRLLAVDKNLDAARALWYKILPVIQLEYRALGTANGDPHWLAVCREAATLRGIPVGASRPPLTPVVPEVRADLQAALSALGELSVETPV